MNSNPILAEVTRGGIVESFHRGAFAIVDQHGEVLLSSGDIKNLVFPRSAIKALQVLPLMLSGAVEEYGFSSREIAVACASHNGEKLHIDAVRSMLGKANIDEDCLECGGHWPLYQAAGREMAVAGIAPTAIHNNCSGKHAGMLATAKYLGEELSGYTDRSHGVQKRVEAIISEYCEHDLVSTPCGTDGCSVPTWAIPLENMALAYSKLANSSDQSNPHAQAAKKIIASVRQNPDLTAGSDRFCTKIMETVPRLYAKTGAEGVYCGSIVHAGIGIAVKCDDGGKRGAEVIFASILSTLDVWDQQEKQDLLNLSHVELKNCNDKVVGVLRAIIK